MAQAQAQSTAAQKRADAERELARLAESRAADEAALEVALAEREQKEKLALRETLKHEKLEDRLQRAAVRRLDKERSLQLVETQRQATESRVLALASERDAATHEADALFAARQTAVAESRARKPALKRFVVGGVFAVAVAACVYLAVQHAPWLEWPAAVPARATATRLPADVGAGPPVWLRMEENFAAMEAPAAPR